MSDIGLNLDGVAAMVVAGALCLLLLIALAVCSLFVWAGHRRTAFPHLVGILCSLAGAAVVLVTALVTALRSEDRLEPNRVGMLLDRGIPLWAPVVLALWPIGRLLYRRRQQRSEVEGKSARTTPRDDPPKTSVETDV